MATISSYVEASHVYSQVVFTAPFDCIVGIDARLTYSGINKRYKGTSTDYALTTSTSGSEKISSVVMKSGDQILCGSGSGSVATLHITGVSA